MSKVPTNPSVVIVGAGSAGIAAAVKLVENSITNVTILEAENRIGGRIHTVELGNGFVDLGAEYCDGENGNVIYEAVKDLDLLDHTRLISPQSNKIYYSNGSILERELALDLNLAILTYDQEINQDSGVNIGEAFLAKYSSTILKKYSGDAGKLKTAKEALRLAHDLIITFRGSFSWDQPSAGKHYVALEGDALMSWKTRGFHVYLDILLKNYPNPQEKLGLDDKLILNKTVKKIVWNGDKVKIEAGDNSLLTADYLIWTPSVGVLKDQKDILFEPQLPQRKKDAIEAIGIGGVMKICLHFPDKWWTDQDNFILFLWSEEDLKEIKKEFSCGPEKDGVPWVSQITGLIRLPCNPSVLIAWVAGELTPKIEEASDEVLLKGCMYVIRRFLGKDYKVTDADKIIGSKWVTNPNFRGTYSYDRVEYFRKDVSYQNQLAEPLLDNEGVPKVLFAGEATHPTMFGSVHGAVETGRREAERIINLHRG